MAQETCKKAELPSFVVLVSLKFWKRAIKRARLKKFFLLKNFNDTLFLAIPGLDSGLGSNQRSDSNDWTSFCLCFNSRPLIDHIRL